MTTELKPCPFCGWDGELIEDGGKYYIECENSACPPQPTTPLVDNVETAVEDWNTRAAPDVPELVRYEFSEGVGEYVERDDGEYVLHSQAAAFIESKEARISEVEQERQIMAKDWFDFCESIGVAIDSHEAVADKVNAIKARAEAAEAKLKKYEQQDPVAMRYDFDGYGFQYIDGGSGSDWQTRKQDAEPLYASPAPIKEQ